MVKLRADTATLLWGYQWVRFPAILGRCSFVE